MTIRSRSISLAIDSHLDNVVLVSMAVKGLCYLNDFTDSDVNRIELCIVEIVNNAIEHAYENKADCRVEVVVTVADRKKLILKVYDTGKKMPGLSNKSIEENYMDAMNYDALKCSGRGLHIVNKVMQDINYFSEKGENCFSMSFCSESIK